MEPDIFILYEKSLVEVNQAISARSFLCDRFGKIYKIFVKTTESCIFFPAGGIISNSSVCVDRKRTTEKYK
jgi:hypothetical protein